MTAPERFADSQIPLASRAPSIHDPLVVCHSAGDGNANSSQQGSFRTNLQGPPRSEMEPPQRCAGPRPRWTASSTAFVISSTNTAECHPCAPRSPPSHPKASPRLPTRRAMMAAVSCPPEPVERYARQIRPSSPPRVELGAERYNQQRWKGFNLVHRPLECFKACGSVQWASSKTINTGCWLANLATCVVRASSILCLRCCGARSSAG